MQLRWIDNELIRNGCFAHRSPRPGGAVDCACIRRAKLLEQVDRRLQIIAELIHLVDAISIDQLPPFSDELLMRRQPHLIMHLALIDGSQPPSKGRASLLTLRRKIGSRSASWKCWVAAPINIFHVSRYAWDRASRLCWRRTRTGSALPEITPSCTFARVRTCLGKP
jgi:hypothetical protein